MKVRVASLSRIPENLSYPITVEDEEIVLFKQDGKVYALFDRCSHADFPLSQGQVLPGIIKCRAHGAEFDLCTGKALCAPAFAPVKVYDVVIEGDDVFLELD